ARLASSRSSPLRFPFQPWSATVLTSTRRSKLRRSRLSRFSSSSTRMGFLSQDRLQSQLEERLPLRPAHGGNPLKKVLESGPRLQMGDEASDGHPRASKHGRAAHHLVIA